MILAESVYLGRPNALLRHREIISVEYRGGIIVYSPPPSAKEIEFVVALQWLESIEVAFVGDRRWPFQGYNILRSARSHINCVSMDVVDFEADEIPE